MADHNGFDKLMRNMSIIPEEDSNSQVLEANEHLIKDGDGVISAFNEQGKLKLSLIDAEPASINSSESGGRNIADSSTTAPSTESLKETDSSENVKFTDDCEMCDLYIDEATLHTPRHQTDTQETKTQNIEEPSTALIEALADSSTFDSNYLDQAFIASPLSNSSLPSKAMTKEELSSATETTLQEGEPTGRRHFEVSNVDESVLRSQTENEVQEKDLNNTEADLDNRPLLERMSSSFSDSDQSTYNANLDTIGPLENPRFLKMLNYSVSRVVQDDGFRGVSNLDLANFTSTQPSANMDSGWAWVVLFAAFCSLSLTGATTFAAGVLMSAILQIDPDITKASWIGAVHISVLCMSGPFVGVILSHLGSKWTAFCAGIVLAGGLIAASFASSIVGLICTHGLIAGMGSGFILNTMFVTVGQYFNRYRGLACGLLATGSGVGMLAGGNALTVLNDNFGLSGTYLLWGGVTLHSLVFALLLRPSPAEQLREAEKAQKKNPTRNKEQEFQGDVSSMMSGTNSIFSRRTNSIRRSQKNAGKTSQQDLSVASLLKSVLHKDISRSPYSVTNQSVRSHRKSNLNISTSSTVAQSKLTLASDIPLDSLNTPSTPNSDSAPEAHSLHASSVISAQDQVDQSSPSEKFSSSTVENVRLLDSSPVSEVPANISSSPTYRRATSELNRSFRRRLISGSSQAPSQYTSTGRLSYRPSIREQLQRNDLDNESLASTLVSHLQPQDALSPRYHLGSRSISSMFGSIASFPTALVIIKDDLSQIDATDGSKKKTVSDKSTGFLDSLRLLRNKPFLVFISTCFLWALADSPFSLYLPAYTVSKGSTTTQASSLYTAMGFGSMCGRFLSGLVASDSGVGPVLLHIGCLSIASLVVGFSSWFTSTYLEQMICAGLFGLYTGSLVPLSSLITIELLGIEELGLGFGFLSMAQGIGYLAGPPLLGIIIKTIGYEMGFRISGIILFSASLLDMIIAVLIRKDSEEDIHDSFDDLEKALRRISGTENEGDDDEIGSYEDEDQSTKLIATAAFHDVAPSNEEEQAVPKAATTTHRDGGGDKKEEPKLKPLPEASPATVNDLETISEEA